MDEQVPTTLRLACGADVPHEVGTRVFNHYDRKAGRIERTASRSQPDTSGALPEGKAWWVDVRHDDDSRAMLDGSRMCSMAFAMSRGWYVEDQP